MVDKLCRVSTQKRHGYILIMSQRWHVNDTFTRQKRRIRSGKNACVGSFLAAIWIVVAGKRSDRGIQENITSFRGSSMKKVFLVCAADGAIYNRGVVFVSTSGIPMNFLLMIKKKSVVCLFYIYLRVLPPLKLLRNFFL